jgi:hypothetical protein
MLSKITKSGLGREKGSITLSSDEGSGGWINFGGAACEACRMSAGLRNGCRDDWAVVANHFIEQRCCTASSMSSQSTAAVNQLYSVPLPTLMYFKWWVVE